MVLIFLDDDWSFGNLHGAYSFDAGVLEKMTTNSELFLTFLRIGAFTIGGGYAMLPLIEKDVVGKGWMTKEEFLDIFAVVQSLPGVFAVNIALFVGYKLKGISGALFCALATIIPSFLIILMIATFFVHFREYEWVERMFKGFRPAVVALIAVPCLTSAKSVKLNIRTVWIPIAAALLIWQLGLSPVWIILAAGIGGILFMRKVN